MSEIDTTTPPDPPAPPANEVAHALLNYLFNSGEVPLGSRIPPERQLAEAFGVGRSAVREALKSLNLLGLVHIRQGDGTYLVSDSLELLPRVMEWGLLLGHHGIRDTIEARLQLEPALAALAAERGGATVAETLDKQAAQLAAATTADAYVSAEYEFHRSIAEAASNAVMANILLGLQALLRVSLVAAVQHGGAAARLDGVTEHEPITAAIGRGDATAAAAAMTSHLNASASRIAALG